jgi:hypothetical protein
VVVGEQGANAVAVEVTLAALESDFSDIDAALAQAARPLAKAVDENPQFPNLWSRYLDCLKVLMHDDDFDQEAEEVFSKYAS